MNNFNEANVNRAANGQFANKPGVGEPAPEAGQASQQERHYATVKTLRESPISGVKTKTVDEKTWKAVDKGFEDQGKYYGDEVRGFRRNSKGQLTFKTGGGYDTIDMDLLGGDGSGRAKAAFTKATGILF